MRVSSDSLPRMNLPVTPGERTFPHKALELDSANDPAKVPDISYPEAAAWAADEIFNYPSGVDDTSAIERCIAESSRRLGDVRAVALWPIAAHAHIQLIHQLRNLINPRHDDDMPLDKVATWAQAEVMRTDLTDPFAIADRIAVAADKLKNTEACAKWPNSANGHRQVVTELSVFLRRISRVLH